MSHPTWVRGLKQFVLALQKYVNKSHPTWVRGLKRLVCSLMEKSISRTLRGCVDWNRFEQLKNTFMGVAPYVGAWIETPISYHFILIFRRTLRGCVDWNLKGETGNRRFWVAPYMGAWIETYSHNRNPHSYHVLLIVTHRLKQYKPEMCKPQIICIGSYRCCL